MNIHDPYMVIAILFSSVMENTIFCIGMVETYELPGGKHDFSYCGSPYYFCGSDQWYFSL